MKNPIFFFIILFTSFNVHSDKLDLSAHNSIIQKLESAIDLSTDDKMVQQSQIIHRLADVYAERARLLAMNEEGSDVKANSLQIISDRKKSISLLQKILPTLKSEARGPILIQIAHLYELNGLHFEALKIFEKIENKPSDYDLKSLAISQIKLGDEAFSSNKLDEAKKLFEKVIENKENPRLAYSFYRLAWIHFNLGQTEIAEKKLFVLLQNIYLFKNKERQIDESFHDEVSHDLALFLAHNDIQNSSLKMYIKLNLEKNLKKNLIFLAKELDRSAKKTSALKVWSLVGNQNISFEDKVEIQIEVTRIEYDLGHFNNLIQELTKSIQLLKNKHCEKNEICLVGSQAVRRLIAEWANSEERKVSPEILAAFKIYTSAFEDYEMNFRAGLLAYKRNQQDEAFSFFNKAAYLLKDINNKSPAQKKIFESSLVKCIEIADFAKDPKTKLEAYQRYLNYNPEGSQKNEVKYQIARWYYDQSNFMQARIEFKKIALDSTFPLHLREKSADLALDSIVILKNESDLELDSKIFSHSIHSKKAEYLQIWRKSILNQTAQLLNSKPTEKQLINEDQKLKSIDLQSFSNLEKNLFIRNQVEISYQLKDIHFLIKNCQMLLKQNDLKNEDQQKAYSYLAWSAEVTLNFKKAYFYLKSITPNSVSASAYYLKLALLKELSEQNPSEAYEKFLFTSQNTEQKAFAVHQMVLHSKKPLQVFKKHKMLLQKNAALYRSAALYSIENQFDSQFAQQLLAHKSFKNTPEAELIKHQLQIIEFKKMIQNIHQLKFVSNTGADLTYSIQKRKNRLRHVENLVKNSIASHDYLAQFLFLPTLSQEYKKLAQTILNIPTPRGLNIENKKIFENQKTQLAKPYLLQSTSIESQIISIWKAQNTQTELKLLTEWSLKENTPGQKLALQELSAIKSSIQMQGLSTQLFEKLTDARQKLSAEAQKIETMIAENPFDFNNLTKLKNLKTSLGDGPIVAYLDQRISEIDSRGR